MLSGIPSRFQTRNSSIQPMLWAVISDFGQTSVATGPLAHTI